MTRDWFWLRRLGGGVSKATDTVKDFIAASLWKVTSDDPEVDQKNYATAYQLNIWVAACVEAICNDCAAVPFDLFKGDELIEKHDLLDLLRYVNEDDDWSGLIAATVGYRRLTGDAYWFLPGGDTPRSKVSAIYPLRPDRITIHATSKGIDHYTYSLTKGDRRGEKSFTPDEIIHFRRWNPLHDVYGQSVIQAIETSINLDNKIRRFNYEFLKRGAVPSGMLTAEGELLPDEAEKVKAKWKAAYGGEAKAGETFITGNSLKYQELGKTPRDGQYAQLARMTREEICAAFQVPQGRVGILDHATYATAKQEDEVYWKSCLLPEIRYIFGRINERLVPRFGQGLELRPDFSGIEALQEGKDTQMTRLQPAVGVPILTPDEARAELGYQPLGGDADKLWLPLNMIVAGALPPPAKGGLPEEPKRVNPVHFRGGTVNSVLVNKGRFGEFGSPRHVEYWKAFDRSLRPLEERFRKTMAGFYLEALDAVLGKLAEEEGKHLKATVPTPDSILRGIFTDEQAENWTVGIMPHVVEGVEVGAKRALADVGGNWNVGRPEVVQWLGEKELKIRTLPRTMHGRLREVLQASVNEGVGVGDMASRIRDLKPEYRYYQAERVARTETVGANNKGCLEGYRQNGVEWKEWLSAIDEKTRTHAKGDKFDHGSASGVNGERQPIDKPFMRTGEALDHPGDQRHGSAGNVCNCRCTIISSEPPTGVVPEVPVEPEVPTIPAEGFNSTAAASQWLSEQHPNIEWNLTGMHRELATALAQETQSFLGRYPAATDELLSVGLGKLDPGVLALNRVAVSETTQKVGSELILSQDYFGSAPKKLLNELDDAVRVGWLPQGTVNVRSPISHELGHIVLNTLPTGQVEGSYREVIAWANALGTEAEAISGYAAQNWDECFAGAISMIENAPRTLWPQGVVDLEKWLLEKGILNP